MPITYDIKTDKLDKLRIQKGIQERIERRGVEIALNLVRERLDASTISKVAGLTISQIEARRKGN